MFKLIAEESQPGTRLRIRIDCTVLGIIFGDLESLSMYGLAAYAAEKFVRGEKIIKPGGEIESSLDFDKTAINAWLDLHENVVPLALLTRLQLIEKYDGKKMLQENLAYHMLHLHSTAMGIIPIHFRFD
jgi:hypothetical protein